MEALRYFRLSHVLRVAASEVAGVLPLMKVSDYLSFIVDHLSSLAEILFKLVEAGVNVPE